MKITNRKFVTFASDNVIIALAENYDELILHSLLEKYNIWFKYWKYKTLKCTKNTTNHLLSVGNTLCVTGTEARRNMWPAFLNWYCYVRSQTLHAKNVPSNMITKHVHSITVANLLYIYIYTHICLYIYEGWNFNRGNYIFTNDTK